MNIGDRVRVNITKPETYARGAVECLNGKTGTIEGALEEDESFTPWKFCVRFDEPTATWWNGQLPVAAFHFHESELVVIDTKGEIK